jgi:hypothetical protein
MKIVERSLKGSGLEKVFKEFQTQARWLGDDVFQLWDDALEFMIDASKISDEPGSNRVRKEKSIRAGVLFSAAAFEAWTNYLADRLIHFGFAMTEAEKDVLQERKRVLENGNIKERPQIYKSLERFLLLYRLVSGRQLEEKTLSNLTSAFTVRDEIVHPKPNKVLDLFGDSKGGKAVFGFLVAEFILASAYSKQFRSATENGAQGGFASVRKEVVMQHGPTA